MFWYGSQTNIRVAITRIDQKYTWFIIYTNTFQNVKHCKEQESQLQDLFLIISINVDLSEMYIINKQCMFLTNASPPSKFTSQTWFAVIWADNKRTQQKLVTWWDRLHDSILPITVLPNENF